MHNKWPHLFPNLDGEKSVTSRSPSGTLFPLEETQRSVLDLLIKKRNSIPNTYDATSSERANKNDGCSQHLADPTSRTSSSAFTKYRESLSIMPSAPKKQKHHTDAPQETAGDEKTPFFRHMFDKSIANHNDHYRFSFFVDNNTFQQTDPNGFKAASTESVNTTFSPEDWHAKFEAGHFAPSQSATGIPRHPRTQSGSRTRGRSPTKSRSNDKKPMQAHVEPESSADTSPSSTKFSQDEWAGTFKPQTFMPPPPPANPPILPQRPQRKRVSSIKPTMGTAAVVDDGETSDDKPLFKGRKFSVTQPTPTPSSPDPMDVDPPVASSTAAPNVAEEPKNFVPSLKRSSVPSQSAPETESLKVNFEDLKIQDLILDLPPPPVAPKIPAALMPPTKETVDAYLDKFKTYMRDWDLFSTRMMLHLVARKNQNDRLGATRWLDSDGLASYRKGMQEDGAVLKWWDGALEQHGESLKQCQILRGLGNVKPAEAGRS